jgi:nondiscriminating glutamyl-tRNA synthetase
VLGPDHTKLSKRHGATSVAEFRTKGYLPESLVNYLALIGWSPAHRSENEGRPGVPGASGGIGPGANDELVPLQEMARRFALSDVVAAAGVFDEEKLAWVNRHYLKLADPMRLAQLSVPFFQQAVAMDPGARGLEFLASVVPIASAAVDRLDQVPSRLGFLFNYDPALTLADEQIRLEMQTEPARAVVSALADALKEKPRLDREAFRAAANEVKTRTGLKAKALFHPIRVVLTGRAEGPELDLAVPAIDRGADLTADAGLPPITGCRERSAAFDRRLQGL